MLQTLLSSLINSTRLGETLSSNAPPDARKIEQELLDKSKLDSFVTPFYDGLSLANIPISILNHFEANIRGRKPVRDGLVTDVFEGTETVVLMLLDGLGYNLLLSDAERRKSPFMHLADSGTLFPITSTFPSTTSTALTSVNSALTPQEHGVIGYTMYLKSLGVVANMIGFSAASDERRGGLASMGVDSRSLLPGPTIYEALLKEDVKSRVLTRKLYKNSSLSRMTHSGAAVDTYVSSSDLFVTLRKLVSSGSRDRRYFFVYWDAVDALSHIHGPLTDEVYAEMASFSYSFKAELLDKLSKKNGERTALLITGDHGLVATPKAKTVMVDRYPKLMDCLLIPPTGDGRASILHTKPGRTDEAKGYVESKFEGKAKVIESQTALEEGFFGYGGLNDEISSRIGDLIILPYDGYSFVYPYKRREEGFVLNGSHGGLLKDEMLVPLLASKLG
ncbi:MAG: alkaline phosphatase family protein [Thaumarchaeota archaeon]|nr:alkaline phosphatase family protein [Nitrososphaerota archaeon]